MSAQNKILLINPHFDVQSNLGKSADLIKPIQPTGLATIAAYLMQHGFDVDIIDQFAERISNDDIVKLIKTAKYLFVGLSALDSSVEPLLKTIKNMTKTPIVLGNMYSVIFADDILKNNLADYIVMGEGEATTLDLAQHLRDKKIPAQLPGIISLSTQGEIIRGPERPLLDPDKIPFPAWEKLKLELYCNDVIIYGMNETIVFPIQLSRGCNYCCIFCSQDKMHAAFRHRSVKRLVDEIEYDMKHFNAKRFFLLDSYFPPNKEIGFEFCDEIDRRGLSAKIQWVVQSRVDKVDTALLKRFKETGCHLVMYGFEAGTDVILKRINKKATIAQAREAMEATKKAKLHSFGLFTIGNPGETKAQIRKTIDFAKELDCDFAKFNIIIPLPGSLLFKQYEERIRNDMGSIKFSSWYDWHKNGENTWKNIKISELSFEELSLLQKQGLIEFYLRPKMIIRHILQGTLALKTMIKGALILAHELWLLISNNIIVKKLIIYFKTS